jgi:hypothetical protein
MRFSIDALHEFILHKGGLLGCDNIKYDVRQLKGFLYNVKCYFSLEALEGMVLENAKDPNKITKAEMKKIAMILLKKPELRDLFKKYAKEYESDFKEAMTMEEWQLFLKEVQTEEMTPRFYQEMLNQLKNPQSILGYNRTNVSSKLSFVEFTNILFSDFNLSMNPSLDKVFMDMSKPFTNYFINTIHNTYPAPDQLINNSSTLCFYEALKMGVRCLEVEVWDGSEGEPIVAPKADLSRMLLFEEVVRCVGKWAFRFSDYPLIFCIENHCSADQMLKMKKYMTTHFADAIYRVTEKEFLKEEFPSPQKLMKKIIIKTKTAYSHKKFKDKLLEKDQKREDQGSLALG